jgi:hypothetical protein
VRDRFEPALLDATAARQRWRRAIATSRGTRADD